MMTTTVSVDKLTGRVWPGPGRANFHPDEFERCELPYRDVYPEAGRPRVLFLEQQPQLGGRGV